MEKKLREGITTGSCAAGAALASVLWQTKGSCPKAVKITTPSGRELELKIDLLKDGWCGVVKDSGDDPDVTDGCVVAAKVEITPGTEVLAQDRESSISFKAGEGVGTVTLPGLKLPPGEPAINPVPRQMIAGAIRPYLNGRDACVTVSIPGGEELAKKTFNSRVGVEGGLSVLGTTGIVRPMSEEAMKDSLALEMKVKVSQGNRRLVFVPGAGGEKAAKALWGRDLCCVLVSNYIGFMLDEALNLGVEGIVVAGFAGKLVKLAADIMNTHSHVADGRRETLCTFAALTGAPTALIKKIYDSLTVQGAMDVIKEAGYSHIWQDIARTGAKKCMMRLQNQIPVAVVLLDGSGQILGKSQNVEDIL